MARIAPLLLVALLSLAVHLAPAAACPSCSPPKKTPPPPPPPKKTPPPSSVPCPPPPHRTPPTPTPPTPTPPTPTPPSPSSSGKCPINALKLLACVDVLNGLVHAVIGGASASDKCCPLLSGVADLDAALCLCTTIKAQALNINLILPIALQVLVNDCGKHVPSDFQCPN